jgi:hypothetical protein
MRGRRRSVVLGDFSSDHLLAVWACSALVCLIARFAGRVYAGGSKELAA